MAELLLELLSEEIPARMQARAGADLARLVTERLQEAGLEHDSAEAYAGPRRLALVVEGLPTRQPDVTEEQKGPRVGAPEKAIDGFLKSVGLASLDQCETRQIRGHGFHFAITHRAGAATAALLPALLGDAVAALAWPKSMRWGAGAARYIRPLHGVLALFDGVPLEGVLLLGGVPLPLGAVTRGHRFMAPAPITVADFADYRTKLRAAFVVLDAAERRVLIETQAAVLAAADGLVVKADPALLDEVAGLVEWPVALMGRIDDDFMDLPPEVLSTAMRAHQKYFSLLGPDGSLAPRFIAVANVAATDGGAAIMAGNERVLRARLADARHFWDRDRAATLASRVPALGGMVFHAKLGTLDQKADRLAALAVEIARHVPGAGKDQVRSAARLAKADLTTEMVGEFPELQGVIGRYYAGADGEAPAVADAIAEHYGPLGPNDACPTAPVSAAIALADKIDTLVGFFAIGERPTGSRDPYSLRRAALGVIRLVIENGLRLPLAGMFRHAGQLYAESLAHAPGEVKAGGLLEFFADRLKVHLRERGVRHDLIAAVFALGDEDDLVRLLARVAALDRFLASDDGANLLTAYRRARNIVAIEEKRDRARYDGSPALSQFAEAEEIALHGALAEAEAAARAALAGEDFAGAMTAVARLRPPVDAFFDHVRVNADDPELRANRLRLLARIPKTLSGVADFSHIEG